MLVFPDTHWWEGLISKWDFEVLLYFWIKERDRTDVSWVASENKLSFFLSYQLDRQR
ncbi:hypothetical protein MIZ03_2222 [Rhodoferax lithotrophicus]|uniref:Uncharacterized protein n=1 Tax=Rhodoferax lithotrophicus TaxID=2798804 RepID=A0ABM7MME3_9BURK|nr:hypothetical protein MIZ03_2222 [Rhodoferax sp. MIZ03]